MSHEVNTEFLEDQFQKAEQAVVENDPQALEAVYLALEEGGFSKEAEELRKEFGVIAS